MHKVPDHALITPTLLRRLEDEAGGRYWALLQNSESKLIEHATGPAIVADQKMFAADMIPALNKHLHHDGAWLIVFCDPAPGTFVPIAGTNYGRFVIMWMDKDGDVQFPIEFDRDFTFYLIEGPDLMLEKCEAAWQNWKWAMKAIIQPKEGQTFKRALGEKPLPTMH